MTTSSSLQPLVASSVHADFRKKYGIPPKGKGPHAPSDYGFPLPPADHPQALKFAHAVLSRAHQSKHFDPDKVAAQVRKAKAIVAKHNKSKKESGLREWSQAVPSDCWERQVALINKAAQASDLFGGPANDDPKLDDASTVRSWDISVWASYPSENRVIIYNGKTSDAWSTNFAIAGDVVTFSNSKPVEIVAESSKATPWRDVQWVDASRPNARGGFIAANPRKAETAAAFLARVPNALPLERAKKLSATERAMYAARRKRVRESATLVRGGEALHERASAQSAFREADATGDVVKGVLLLRAGPGNLADRHYYTKECIADAAATGIFEGAPAYFNHPSTFEEQTRPERDVHQLAGWYSDVVAKPCTDPELGATVGLFADFHPRVGNDEVLSLVRTCVEYAKQYPRKAFAGLSIYASGDGEPDQIDGEQWNRVDKITAVESVDIVTKAGAGGAIVPLKESHRMSKTKTQDVTLVLDPDAVKSGVKSLLENASKQLKAKLAESGVQITPEQDAEIDRQLGIVDGGALDTVLDKATGVAEPDEEDAGGADPAAATDPVGGAMAEDDDMESMTPDQLKAALKAERLKSKTMAGKLGEATGRVSLIERQRLAEDVVAKENIPDTFRPRLVKELVSEGYKTEKAMREHTQAFDKAFIRPHIDGAGISGTQTSTAAAGNFKFDEEG